MKKKMDFLENDPSSEHSNLVWLEMKIGLNLRFVI